MTRQRADAWDAALHTIKKLRANGHVALLAGGCVRDRLLSRTPKDYDVATDATPQRVKEIFPKARQVGAKFGVMLVRKSGHDIEVATFRTDGTYSDGRHPDEIHFGTEVQDALRRDFTINGLFFDPVEGRVIDHVNGQVDLAARILRTIGDPERRFAEDHLRMLRAVRFAARFGFDIEPETMAAIRRNAPHLAAISAERIWLELEAILTAPTCVVGWTLLLETGLRGHLAKNWPPEIKDDQSIHRRLGVLSAGPVGPALVLAVCLQPYPREQVAGICRTLRLSNRLSKAVIWLGQSLAKVRAGRDLELADLKLLMAEEHWDDLLELLRVDLAATVAELDPYECVRERASQIPADDIAPPPLVTGDDLNQLGLLPGPRFGELLEAAFRAQLNGQVNTRAEALALVHRLAGS